MMFRLKNSLSRNCFDYRTRGIYSTGPLRLDPSAGFGLLSQIRHSDLTMYLLAVKSFADRLAPASIHIVDDGSLTDEDRRLLVQHVPGHVLLQARDYRRDDCPKGGTWERLIAIAHLVRDSYIIQLDADTLALDALPEVADCIRMNSSFAIGTWDNQTPETMKERRDTALRHLQGDRPHIQLIAESRLDALDNFDSMLYIRGCSGFSGFARGCIDPDRLGAWSSQMRAVTGDRWSDWGTEQFMSNIVVANSPSTTVLPHPRYCDCTRYVAGHAAFVHFIGTCRFKGGRYARAARQLIDRLSGAQWNSS